MAKKRRKGSGEKFSFRNEYKRSWKFIKSSKEHIYVAILVFAIFTALAFFFGGELNKFVDYLFGVNISETILGYLRELMLTTQGMDFKEITGFIFLNNLQSSFSGMVLGIALGIFPLFAALFNGYILGFVALLSVKSQGIWVLWRILPHGIFELPAIFISLGLGMRLGFSVFQNKNEKFKDLFWNSIRVFILVIIPLLIIAAFIEGALISLSG